jgi:hypothetical protein
MQYGVACAREEQAQVVVDFGDRADGRARVVTGRLLLNRNRRRQPLDQIDVGFLDALQKLPGIGRQGFDVAALSLGVKGVEGQRRFARTGKTGDHDQPVAGQVEIDVLQVVGARTADPYLSRFVHGWLAGLRGCGKPVNIRNSAVRQQTPCPSRIPIV